ncbi:hypothetical protein [Actinomadura sp. 9N215]|uniref:hypothetical protein n=1 Tax=Actinomadura sp. 9N215 TaxID=3375150 RepID=UPI003788B07C
MARRLQHLVAHAWLDVDDLYRVGKVGVYLDPGTLITWPVRFLADGLLPPAGPDTARTDFLAWAGRAITAPRPVPVDVARKARPGRIADDELNRALPLGIVYGPEKWDTFADAEWSYWDLWMSVVAIVDHGGD